jgi:outer membrane immunogenic protein
MKLHSSVVRGLFVASAVSVLAMSANAADIYRAPEGVSYKDAPEYAPAWAGWYAGVNGGYGWSDQDSKLSGTANPNYCLNTQCVQTAYSPVSGTKAFSTDGGFGGGQIGYNWQPSGSAGYKDGPALGHIVFGIEADIQGAAIDGSGALSLSPASASATGKNDLDWFGTVRGRLGYAVDSNLLYITGGLAFGGVKDTLSLTSLGTTKTVSSDNTDTGFVLGGGLEHLFSPRWSGKVEYQYIDLGSDKLSTSVNGATATLDAEHKYNTVRVGLNYHILPGYEPLK